MLLRAWCLMRFRLIKTIMILSLVGMVSCQRVHKHTPRPLQHIEVFMHPRANQGVPLVLQWVFILDRKAYEEVAGLTALQFLQSEKELKHLFPREIFIEKHTAFPGTVDVLFPKTMPINAKVLLFAHFVNKGVNRWVVLPRERIRINIQRDTLEIQTRFTPPKKGKSRRSQG